MSSALLLAETEPGTRGFLERHLTDDGFHVLGAGAGGEALDLAEQARPDLLLLSARLDESVVELCKRLREGEPGRSWDRDVPVIVLGQPESDPVDRVRALSRGADDFVSTPFHYEELLARIHAVLRRSAARAGGELLRVHDVEIDLRTRRVRVAGVPVLLAGKELQLLVKLAEDPTRVWTKEELLREVWGFRSQGRTRTLDSHASRLRRKLNLPGLDRAYVLNVWGVGYRLVDD